MKIAILAGGTGSRLWPWSRLAAPKQILSLFGGATLLQHTYRRLRRGFAAHDILVVAGTDYAGAIKKQLPALPKNNLLIEPVRRDSAGAIALAAAHVYRQNPRESLVTVHSDHWLEKDLDYVRALKRLGNLAQSHSQTILAGAKPTYPETGYGYIKVDKKIVQSKIYRISKFIEKPPLRRARQLFNRADIFWNVGWFGWRVDRLLALLEKHLPRHADLVKTLNAGRPADWQKIINREFSKLPSVAIDYGLIEKTKELLLWPYNSGWTDIGHWRSVYEMSKKDKDKNVVAADSLLLDSRHNIFISQSKKFIAALGVDNLIMVETADAILLLNKERAAEVKNIIAKLKSNARYQRLL